MFCPACGKENTPDSRFCSGCGGAFAARTADPYGCPGCGAGVGAADRFCPRCGVPLEMPPLPAAAPPARPPRRAAPAADLPEALPVRPPPPPGRQSPLLALFLGLLLPGAGQAYNGQPIKGFFLFFSSVLALPYFLSLYDAYATAARIRAAGLSSGCAGFFWVFLQFWLAVNTALLAVLVLTLMGVLT